MKKSKPTNPLPVFPDWLPRNIAAKASELFKDAQKNNRPELADLVHRLACDKRMKKVWRELTSRDRKSNHFQHEIHAASEIAYFPKESGFVNRDAWIRDLFLAQTFEQSVRMAAKALPVADKSCRKMWRERAIFLQSDAESALKTYNARPPSHQQRERAAALQKAAEVYTEMANDLDVQRLDRVNATTFSIWLAARFRNVFCKSLHGTVANWTSVALDKAIPQSSVREWCRGPWGMERKKPK